DDDEVVEVVGCERRAGRTRRDQIPMNSTAREEELLVRTGVDAGHDEAEAEAAQLLEPSKTPDHTFERGDPVAHPSRLLVPQAFRQLRHPGVEPAERLAVEQVRELPLRAASERPRGAVRVSATAQRP